MVKNYLKTLLLATFAMMLPLVASAEVEINEATFPDEHFRNWLLSQSYGADGDKNTNPEVCRSRDNGDVMLQR